VKPLEITFFGFEPSIPPDFGIEVVLVFALCSPSINQLNFNTPSYSYSRNMEVVMNVANIATTAYSGIASTNTSAGPQKPRNTVIATIMERHARKAPIKRSAGLNVPLRRREGR
jgi:hypothetical protein